MDPRVISFSSEPIMSSLLSRTRILPKILAVIVLLGAAATPAAALPTSN
jgi:hypothetical protein